jgi:hypothetical protein
VASGPIYASLCCRIAVWPLPPGPGEVPATAVPHLARLDASPGLATVLAPGRPVRRATLRIASTLYDGLRPAALFDALGSQLKELVLVLAPDVDARTRGRLRMRWRRRPRGWKCSSCGWKASVTRYVVMLSEPVLFCLIVAPTCPRALVFVRFLVLGRAAGAV